MDRSGVAQKVFRSPYGLLCIAVLVAAILGVVLIPIGDTFFANVFRADTQRDFPCCLITSLNTNAYVRYHFPKIFIDLVNGISLLVTFGFSCVAIAFAWLRVGTASSWQNQKMSDARALSFSITFVIVSVLSFEGVFIFFIGELPFVAINNCSFT